MLFPYSARSATWYGAYKAAENLHQVVWQKDLEKRFLEVNECEGLKYLPSTEVRDLRLEDLGCDANIILIREDYYFTLRELEKYRQLSSNDGSPRHRYQFITKDMGLMGLTYS